MQKSPAPIYDTLSVHLNTPDWQPNHINIKYVPDVRIGLQFLLSYQGSEATFNTYRRELERLLHWSHQIAETSILELNRAKLEDYLRFCQNPPKSWVGTKQVARYLTKNGLRTLNQDWRPFTIRLPKAQQNSDKHRLQHCFSEKTVKEIFAVLSTLFQYLVQQGHCYQNPVQQIRQKSHFIQRTACKQPIRKISDLQWDYVLETAEIMATENSIHERTLLIISLLYGLYLRISELAASHRWVPKMCDFYQDSDHNWWFQTIGKGNKSRDIAVSNQVLAALVRYRQHLNLSAYPTRTETQPLLPKQKGQGAIQSTRMIRKIVQACFDYSYQRMCAAGLKSDANELQEATVHWLRHTGISNDIQHRPREHVRDDAGHSSSMTTDKYIDVSYRERHASAKHKVLRET